jgi:hypothetical protein
LSGGFKRSGIFGIVGVIVVAALVAVIALSTGEGQANPKTTYALIFGVIAVFFVVLFALQRGDLNRASGSDARETARGAAEGGRQIENPTALGDAELWATMAVGPIDREAIEARGAMWGAARRSQSLAMVVTLLIMLTVPSIYLLESFVPLLIGGPLIAIAALWGGVKALMPGGDLDKGYDNVSRAMAPLGLAVTERPTVSIEMREPVTPRMGPRIRGALVLSGERNGRRVSIRVGETDSGSRSEVSLAASVPEFEAKARDGKVRPAKDAPERVASALRAMPNSTRWKKVAVEGGNGGIVVQRKGGGQSDWLCDLWLAERLAESAG